MAPKSPTPDETSTPKRRAAARAESTPHEPNLLEDRRFRAALVFLAAVVVFSAGYLVGHAAGSPDEAPGDPPVIGSDGDDQREGYIGVVGTDARRREGALILEVLPGSPAARAGLERGDLIVSAGDESIPSIRALVRVVRATAPGRTLELGVVRGDRRSFVEVEVGARPAGDLGPAEQFPPPNLPEG